MGTSVNSKKTHKFDKNEDIKKQSLNFGPIIQPTEQCTYNATQIISNYFKPLYTTMNILSATRRTFQYLAKNNYYFSSTRSMCHTTLNRYLQMSRLLKPFNIFLTKLMSVINYLDYAVI